MKIMHVCKKYPPMLGGDAVVVRNLERQQRAAGHEVVIVTSNCAGISLAPQVYTFGLRDTSAQLDNITLRRIISLIALFFKMFWVLHRERPTVVHTHSIDMAFFVSFAARLYRIPVVHTFHIVTFYDESQPAIRRKAELWLAKKAGLFAATTPNGYDVKKLQAAGLEQTVLLPNGVDIAFWQQRKITRRADSEPFTFITVGRLEQQKGCEYLVRAAALLAGTQPKDFRVVIVGDGSQMAALRALVHTLHVEDIVTLVGRKEPSEIRALFEHADAAVFPSLYETTPITMLEAWAAGVPVIVTSVGILRDTPADFGAAYVVPIANERALMHAMAQCMASAPQRNSVAAKGRAEAQHYAWPIVAQTAEAIYRSAC